MESSSIIYIIYNNGIDWKIVKEIIMALLTILRSVISKITFEDFFGKQRPRLLEK